MGQSVCVPIDEVDYGTAEPELVERLQAVFTEEFRVKAPTYAVAIDAAVLASVRVATDDGAHYIELIADGGTTRLVWDGTTPSAERIVRELADRTAATFI